MRRVTAGLAVLVAGCSPSLVDYESRFYVVQPGDTLYAIAWEYGLDHRELARWNGLEDAGRITVGQRLRLRPVATRSPSPSSVESTPRASRSPAARSLPEPRTLPPPTWQWPTDGTVVTHFGSRDGIDSGIGIVGNAGQPVVAAADGRVVYAGNGLIGYGQLVIIKHNDTYLTAYGHTDRVLVREGDDVTRGQRIAGMGFGPQRQPRLHFEIRRNGVPVDPLRLLSAARN